MFPSSSAHACRKVPNCDLKKIELFSYDFDEFGKRNPKSSNSR